MTPLSAAEIAELRDKIAKATPGPWSAATAYDGVSRFNDFALLIAARTALPRALDMIEAQAKEIERLREALTPSASTKIAYIGEFEVGEFKFTPRDSGVPVRVPWTVIKEIMEAIRARAALAKETNHD